MTTVVQPPKRNREQELMDAIRRMNSGLPPVGLIAEIQAALMVINGEANEMRHAGHYERANALSRARVTLARALTERGTQ